MMLRVRNSLVTCLLLVALGSALGPGPAHAIQVGQAAPDFTLTDCEGRDHSLSGYSSYAVLLMFLSCSEAASIALAPLLDNDLHVPYSSQGLRVLGIDCQSGTLEEINRFQNQTGVRFPLLMYGETVLTRYELPVVSFVLIDGGGAVRYVSEGSGGDAYDRDALISAVEKTLREENATKEATWGLIKGLYSD